VHQETQGAFDFDAGPPDGGGTRDDPRSLDERFEDYHAAHPEIYREFARLARLLRDRGHDHYGAKGLFEALRFHHAVDSRPGDLYKLNNNYTSRYVRLLVEEQPEFEGFFETRKLKSCRTEEDL
jgi:hypothetical protein